MRPVLTTWLMTLGLSPLVLPFLFVYLGGPRLARPRQYVLTSFVVLALGAALCLCASIRGASAARPDAASNTVPTIAGYGADYTLALYLAAALAFLVGLRAAATKRKD